MQKLAGHRENQGKIQDSLRNNEIEGLPIGQHRKRVNRKHQGNRTLRVRNDR